MKYFRVVYFFFVFFLIGLVTFAPERLRGAPRPAYEVRIKFGLTLIGCTVLGYYSLRTFLKDWRTLRGSTSIIKQFPLRLDSDKAMVLGPISGEGPCQMQLTIKTMSPEPGRDEMEISILNEAGVETERETFGFAFAKENYEVNITTTGCWIVRIKIKFVQKPSEPFTAKVKLQVLGRAQNVSIPAAFTVI